MNRIENSNTASWKSRLQAMIDQGQITTRQQLLDLASERSWKIPRNGKNYLTILMQGGDRFRLRFNTLIDAQSGVEMITSLSSTSDNSQQPLVHQDQLRIHSVYAFIAKDANKRRACYVGLTVDLNRRYTEHLKRHRLNRSSSDLFRWAFQNKAELFYVTLTNLVCTQSDAMKCEAHWTTLALKAGFETPGIERWMKRPRLWSRGGQPEIWPESALTVHAIRIPK